MVDLRDSVEWIVLDPTPYMLPWISYDYALPLNPAGPPILDQHTIGEFFGRLETGSLVLDGDWRSAARAFERSTFDDLYAAAIDAELSAQTFVLPIDVRVGALVRVLDALMAALADRDANDEQAAKARAVSHQDDLLEAQNERLGGVPDPIGLELIDPARLAALLDLNPNMLTSWRTRGVGPAWIKLSNNKRTGVRYAVPDVLAWLAERRQVTDITHP